MHLLLSSFHYKSPKPCQKQFTEMNQTSYEFLQQLKRHIDELTPGDRSNPTALVATPDSSISGWFLLGACTNQMNTKHETTQKQP
jgi:hypothetical protein